MSKKIKLVVRFNAELHETLSGFSPGGAVFPREIVEKVDFCNNTLFLKDITLLKYKWGGVVVIGFGKDGEIWLKSNLVKKIEIEKAL